MNVVLFDDQNRDKLLPLTYTRPVADLRIGILTIREKWEKAFNFKITGSLTQDYLATKYAMEIKDENLLINGSICPNPELSEAILKLENNQKLVNDEDTIAVKIGGERLAEFLEEKRPIEKFDIVKTRCPYQYTKINNVWDLFQKNDEELKRDYHIITKGRESQTISDTNKVLGDQVFIEKGAKVECSILNSTTGPIYVGSNAEIMEGSVIRGGLALCENAILKMGTKIYGATTVGPHSRIGGEVNNSVVIGYSNKGHDGFMGNSVIGEWCNLGADTNTSNLKNNYGDVKVWSYVEKSLQNSKQQFCGLIMGDHSKSSINSMFNTGTVVGVCANIFGAGFPSKFIPSFTWGGAHGFEKFKIDKAFEVAQKVMQRRGVVLNEQEKDILKEISNISQLYR